MHHDLHRYEDIDAVTTAACHYIAEVARTSVAANGNFHFAVSGGTTPWAMLNKLTSLDLPWDQVAIYQVDERVAPDGDPDRNLTHLLASFDGVDVAITAMPVNDTNLDAGADWYGRTLPERFDLVHLGLGPDGHTASLLPGDRALEVIDRPVALTGPYQGHRRMTLTYPALARADQLLWLVAGSDKASALTKLLAGDASIPASRVVAAQSTIFADVAATPQ